MSLFLLRNCVLQVSILLALASSLSGLGPEEPPAGTRGWEAVPGVIRDDGLESFRLEVHTGGPVAGVILRSVAARLIPPSGSPLVLHDDGVPPDQVAGDFIYTAGPFTYRAGEPMPAWYMNDPSSPAGLDTIRVGEIVVQETTGATTGFLVGPGVGVLSATLPATRIRNVSAGLAVSAHLVNAQVTGWNVQGALRNASANLAGTAQQVYGDLPDLYDFLLVVSTNRLEQLASGDARNFVAGQHLTVKINYTGTGQALMDNTAAYGSSGRLLGVVAVDAYDRGLYSENVTHELLHQWAAWLDPALGLNDAEGHYDPRSGVGSLLGGQKWVPNGTLDCGEGPNGAHQAAALDRYLMGLLDASQLPPQYVYAATSPLPLFRCGQTINDVARTVTVSAILQRHGPRFPSPAIAQRHFNVAFVAESRGRLLTPTEMTFYEMLAGGYTRPVPAAEPDPYIGFDWAPITRFFGPDATFGSTIFSGDLNGDGNVDAADLALFMACGTGPRVPYQPTLPAGCSLVPDDSGHLSADFDADGDIDAADFAVLQRLYSRPKQ